MKEENRCESPMGGWFATCDKFDKNGTHSVGIGKVVAEVTYYNQSQGEGNLFTYKCCKNCAECYAFDTEVTETEDNVVVKIQYYDKDNLGSFDNTKKVIFAESEASD